MKKRKANKPSSEEMDAIWQVIVDKRFEFGYGRRGYNRLSQREKVWYNVWTFESLSDIGGFYHYFDSTAGEDVDWLLESLEAIGAQQTRAALIELCKIFPKGKPSSKEATRKNQVDKLMGEIDEDDLPWPKRINEDWEELLWKYWTTHED